MTADEPDRVRTVAMELPPLRYAILLDMLDGMKASRIAAKRGLTKEFVKQELVEAMLYLQSHLQESRNEQ